jgi:hypothetical protein
MSTTVDTKLAIKSFDEPPYRELDDGRKFTKGEIVLSVSDKDIEADITWDALSLFAADGTASYVGLMHVTGRVGERTGDLVLSGGGSYDGTTARIELTVLPDSGTGDFAGVGGSASSASTRDDYPNMPLTLTLE